MTSSDNKQVVTFDVYNKDKEELRVYIHSENEQTRNELKTALKDAVNELSTEIRINAIRIDEVKNSTHWNFTTLSISPMNATTTAFRVKKSVY